MHRLTPHNLPPLREFTDPARAHVSSLTNKVNTLRLEFTPCGVYPFLQLTPISWKSQRSVTFDTTLQIAHHVEELTRSRMQSLLCAGAYPVEEFTPLLSTLCARSYSAQEYTPLLSSPCARVYPVEECTPLLSLPNAQEFTLCTDSHLTIYHLFGSSPLQRMPMSLG